MNYKNSVLILLALLFSSKLSGQAITEDAVAINKKAIQLEGSLIYEHNNSETIWTFPSALLRYGLNHNIELRLATAYENKKHVHRILEGSFSNIEAGLKVHLFGKKATNLAFISHFIFPSNFNDWNKNNINTTAALVFSQAIGKQFQIGSSVQYVFENNNDNDVNYSLVLYHFINDKWNVYAETYGEFVSEEFISNIDFGLGYLVNDKLEWQVSAGTNLKQEQYHFMSTGFVWQIK
jgi:hypothetical protein